MSEFGTLNLEEMADENTRLKTQGGGAGFLDQFVPMPEVKPGQTGSVAVRVLPPVKGCKLFQYNRVHTLNGRKIHCPRPLVNGKWDRNVACPICDYYQSMWKQIDKLERVRGKEDPAVVKMKDDARELKAVERYYYNAIVRSMVVDGKELKNVGPRILSIGQTLHKLIVKAIYGEDGDPDSKLGNITDLKNGWDFIIRKEVTAGSEGFPKYERSGFSRNSSPTGNAEEINKWKDALHDLTKLRNPKGLDYLEKELAIHRGLIPDESESFNAEEFDAKWRQKGQDDVDETARSSTAVAESAPATKAAPKVVEAKKPETLGIEDEKFLKELEEMEA